MISSIMVKLLSAAVVTDRKLVRTVNGEQMLTVSSLNGSPSNRQKRQKACLAVRFFIFYLLGTCGIQNWFFRYWFPQP